MRPIGNDLSITNVYVTINFTIAAYCETGKGIFGINEENLWVFKLIPNLTVYTISVLLEHFRANINDNTKENFTKALICCII